MYWDARSAKHQNRRNTITTDQPTKDHCSNGTAASLASPYIIILLLVISYSSSLYCCYFFILSQFWLLGSILLRHAIKASRCSLEDSVHSPVSAVRPLQTPAAICWNILTSNISVNTAILLAVTGLKHIRYRQYQTAKCFPEPPPLQAIHC